jgi:hypothetical protein
VKRRPVPDPAQPNLLEWQPSRVVRRFAAELIRAASLASRLCRAQKLTLKECGQSRDKVAAGMSAYLGETITEAMLNSYVSESMDAHVVNTVRFIAFIAVTGDHRPLNALLDELNLVVIDKKYLPWIEVGMLREQQEKLNRDVDFARRRAVQGVTRD